MATACGGKPTSDRFRTIDEPGYTTWIAVGHPMPNISPADEAAVAVIKMPDVQARFRAVSVEPIGNSPAEMAAFIKQEALRWSDIIKKNNIVVD